VLRELAEEVAAREPPRSDEVEGALVRIIGPSLGDSVSILLPNAILQSAAELSLKSGDPSSCQLFQHLRCDRLVCSF